MVSRRQLMIGSALIPGLFTRRGLLAELLTETVSMTEGPFYPDRLPLDTDNDLLIINDSITPAVGAITHLSGRVLTKSGEPVRNAFVEIWQVDNNGAYLHRDSNNAEQRDKNFQGYGRFLTDSEGTYYFRTIKPVAYPGRTPHIHFAISQNGHRLLTTQLLIKDEPQNDRDGLYRSIRDPKLRETILADFVAMADSKIGELSAKFDIVLGITPEEEERGEIKGGIAKPMRR
jgi:protocatechuate 3,4-dioxygenase beta subunit